MNFEEFEDADGVRLAWNCFPSTKVEATRAVVPVSAMYTPLHEKDDLRVLQYEPVTCKPSCRAVINPFCYLDTRSKVWTCPFCMSRNVLPAQYRDITQESIPFELDSKASTVEYELQRPPALPPVFLFVVDLCQDEENLAALRDSLVVTLSLLPANAKVGLITFGAMTQVYELGYSACSKTYVFRGTTDYNVKQVSEMLALGTSPLASKPGTGVNGAAAGPVNTPALAAAMARFLVPLQDCELQVVQAIESLTPDPWEVPTGSRPSRCTGVAVSVAVSLLERLVPNSGARVLLFCAGAPTEGPGLVVDKPLKEPIRSHHDIDTDSAPHFSKATKFYQALSKRAATNGHSVDIFVGCSTRLA